MDPSVYIPAYLERTYLASHPELTDAARELVHNDISANPQKYAQSEHAQALLSYAGVHRHLLDELHRIEDMGSDEEFEHEVETAIDSLPDRFKRALDNVGIAVADEPNERERATMQRQCDELLGLYEGVPITRRFTGYSGVMPDIIPIYKGPHERVCATRDDLRRQIRKTVLHELGHYFGFDDDYLHAHGY